MSRKSAALISAGVAAVLASFLWLPRRPEAAPAQPAAGLPSNPAHERAVLEQLLKRKPDHAPILLRLAQLDLESRQFETARRRLERLLQADPANLDALLELGRACFEMGDFDCAVKRTSQVLQSNPDHPDALYNLGAIYANRGRADQARRYWSHAAKVAPGTESGRKAAEALKQI